MTYLNALFATSTLLIFSPQSLPLYHSSYTSCPWLLHASSPVLLVLTSLPWSHILLHYSIYSSSAKPFLVIWLLLHLFILVSPQDLWSSLVLSFNTPHRNGFDLQESASKLVSWRHQFLIGSFARTIGNCPCTIIQLRLAWHRMPVPLVGPFEYSTNWIPWCVVDMSVVPLTCIFAQKRPSRHKFSSLFDKTRSAVSLLARFHLPGLTFFLSACLTTSPVNSIYWLRSSPIL